MSEAKRDLYYVAVKLFLRDGEKLIIIHDIFGDWDLPGGRIKTDEFETPLESVVARKVREELGPEVRYELGKPNGVFFRVERMEADLGERVRIFAVGYDATYLGGEIRPGEYLDEVKWVDLQGFKPDDYLAGGWLAGVEEYLARQK